MKRLPAYLFLFFISVSLAQQKSPLERLVIESFGYPDFGDNSNYGQFEIDYALNDGTLLALEGLNQQNTAFRRFNMKLMLKQRLAKRLWGMVGYESEWDLTDPNWKQNPSKSLYLGVEYAPKPNLSINAGLRRFLNQPSFNPLGTERSNAKAQWTIGSKIKF